MQECAMTARLGLALNWNALLERHGTAMAVLALAAVFASGFFDAAILKRTDWACATWFMVSCRLPPGLPIRGRPLLSLLGRRYLHQV